MKSSNLDCETSTGVPLSGVGSFRARLGDGALLLESFEAAVEVASPPLLCPGVVNHSIFFSLLFEKII